MIKATVHDRSLVAELLASAFNGYSSIDYLLPENERRNDYLLNLMKFNFDVCYRFGEVWLSNDLHGCILILFPHKKRLNVKLGLMKLRLFLTSIRADKYQLKRYHLAKMEKIRPGLAMSQICYIGVHPNYQNRGIGTALVTAVLERLKKLGLPVYTELAAYQYLAWFERFGFEGYEVYDCTDYKFVNFFLKNDLKTLM